MKLALFLIFATILNLGCSPESEMQVFNQSEMGILPSHLRGIPWKGRIMRHGLLRWEGKKPFSPLPRETYIRKGKELYTSNCMGCHGADGHGQGPFAIENKFSSSDLTLIGEDFSHHYLAFQIEMGKGAMPSWADVLNEDEIWALTSYIHSITER